MKLIITIALVFSSILTFAQNNNESLYKAVMNSDSLMVKELLNKGADANYKMKTGQFEMSMLIWAVQKQNFSITKLLIEHKAEVDWRDWFKTTALMYAANSGNKPIVQLLIAHGADVNASDGQGNSVLSAAQESKNQELITLIENKIKEKSVGKN
jgi:ankyrin repeat protein